MQNFEIFAHFSPESRISDIVALLDSFWLEIRNVRTGKVQFAGPIWCLPAHNPHAEVVNRVLIQADQYQDLQAIMEIVLPEHGRGRKNYRNPFYVRDPLSFEVSIKDEKGRVWTILNQNYAPTT